MSEVDKTEHERTKDIPPVGKPKTQTNWFGVGITAVVLGVLIYGFFNSNDKKNTVIVEEPKSFKVSNNSNESLFKREPQKESKKHQNQNRQPTRDEILAALADERRKQEQAEAIKAEELAKKIEDSKRSSPIRMLSGAGNVNRGQTTPFAQTSYPTIDEPNEKPKPGELDLGRPKQVDSVVAVQINDTGKMIAAGKFIKGVLETAIDSTLPGQVRAVVANDIYSENGQRVLINKGSRLVGQYQSGIRQGQNRVFVIWSHVTTPNGVQVALESIGTDALGMAGLSGDYDSHFFKRFGGALMLSIVEEAGEQSSSSLDITGGNSLQRASAIALENSINIPPTIYVDQGEPINVFIARNLRFEGIL